MLIAALNSGTLEVVYFRFYSGRIELVHKKTGKPFIRLLESEWAYSLGTDKDAVSCMWVQEKHSNLKVKPAEIMVGTRVLLEYNLTPKIKWVEIGLDLL